MSAPPEFAGPVKPFCPCDAGRPQDCQPEDWGDAHAHRDCTRCGKPDYQHVRLRYCRPAAIAAALASPAVAAYTWRGIDQDGAERGGSVSCALYQVVRITESYHARGWRALTVWRGRDDSGQVVARIATEDETGERTWWAESVDSEANKR